MAENTNGEIVIFKTEDDKISVDVRFEGETVWLSQQQMAELYQTSRTNVVEHIKNIYEEEELDADSTCRNFRQVQKEGNRNVSREIPFYNLDAKIQNFFLTVAILFVFLMKPIVLRIILKKNFL